jgi:two-component system, NarL family, nitrate/nitrite response regulator NarL
VTEPPISVLVADDHAIVRSGIRHVLEHVPGDEVGFAVVGEAATAEEALTLAAELQPDVMVLDISMPGQSGLQVAAELRRRAPSTRVLILSMHDNTEYVLETVRAGAHGYLLKDAAAVELRGAIRAVRRGESYFSPPIASRMSAALRGALEPQPLGALDQLTAREREVLIGVARGGTNREIALALGISHRTVETHRESLMRKLGIRTVAGLTRFALEAGLVGGES